MKKVLLDSVIVGKLNHDLRAKRNLELLEGLNQDFRIKKKIGDNVWNEWTVMFDKRYQVHRTFFTVKHFPNSVDAAMPNKNKFINIIIILRGVKIIL